MRPSLLAFLALADAALSASASALPTTQDGIRIGSLIARALSRRDPLPSSSSAPSGWPSGVSCDLTKAVMPQAPNPLPSPSAGLVLVHVLIGRGTQNYTCDGNATSSKPVANGAVATLFNASCIAANYPDLLSTMPDVALQFPVPSVDDISNSGGGGGGGGSRSPNSGSDAAAAYLGGFHYFTDPTTPVFNLDTTAHDLGVATVKKANATSAPMNALPGSNGRGFGSVPWLKLVSNTTAAAAAAATNTVVYKEVYRLQTAGGQPPETCVGQPASIQVDYAAQYWFYS